MPGPRIYTEAWERLKVAARETEAEEREESRHKVDSPEKPKRLRGPRLSVVAIAVLALLSILTASLWIDSQARLISAANNVADVKTRLELLPERMTKVEDERQRLEEENGTLSRQYEQRAAEVAQLEEELQARRSRQENIRSKPKQPAARAEAQPLKAADAPRAAQEALPTPRDEMGSALKLQSPEQRDVKVHKID